MEEKLVEQLLSSLKRLKARTASCYCASADPEARQHLVVAFGHLEKAEDEIAALKALHIKGANRQITIK